MPLGNPYVFGAEAYGDYFLMNLHSWTVESSEVPGISSMPFDPIWCIKWGYSGLDGGSLAYTCGGHIKKNPVEDALTRGILVVEIARMANVVHSQPIVAIANLDPIIHPLPKNGPCLDPFMDSYGIICESKATKRRMPLDLLMWKVAATNDWNALKLHHDGGLISRARVGNLLAIWPIYVFLLIILLMGIDIIRLFAFIISKIIKRFS